MDDRILRARILVRAWCATTGSDYKSASFRMSDSGRLLWKHGQTDISQRDFDDLVTMLSRNWPLGARWPDVVPLPIRSGRYTNSTAVTNATLAVNANVMMAYDALPKQLRLAVGEAGQDYNTEEVLNFCRQGYSPKQIAEMLRQSDVAAGFPSGTPQRLFKSSRRRRDPPARRGLPTVPVMMR